VPEGGRLARAGRADDRVPRQRIERPDAALLDVVMPGLDGMRVAEILAREQPDLRIAFISGRSAFGDQLEGLGRGATDYITKPFDPAELVERVRSLLAGP